MNVIPSIVKDRYGNDAGFLYEYYDENHKLIERKCFDINGLALDIEFVSPSQIFCHYPYADSFNYSI